MRRTAMRPPPPSAARPVSTTSAAQASRCWHHLARCRAHREAARCGASTDRHHGSPTTRQNQRDRVVRRAPTQRHRPWCSASADLVMARTSTFHSNADRWCPYRAARAVFPGLRTPALGFGDQASLMLAATVRCRSCVHRTAIGFVLEHRNDLSWKLHWLRQRAIVSSRCPRGQLNGGTKRRRARTRKPRRRVEGTCASASAGRYRGGMDSRYGNKISTRLSDFMTGASSAL